MYIKSKKSWEIPENLVTDKETFYNRRKIIKAMAISAIGLPVLGGSTFAEPVKGLGKSGKYTVDSLGKDVKLTDKEDFTSYNNFYEFSFNKYDVRANALRFKSSPWQLKISGLVNKPITLNMEDIFKKFPQEERIYRLRCVETWSAIVPWVRFSAGKTAKVGRSQNQTQNTSPLNLFMTPR